MALPSLIRHQRILLPTRTFRFIVRRDTLAALIFAGQGSSRSAEEPPWGDDGFSDLVPGHHGEQFNVSERMVVSPGAGVFHVAAPADGAGFPTGRPIHVGTLLGHIGDQEVRSAFAGHLMGMLAMPGERLRAGQPVAWLRTT